eukprot:3246694-Rhodomonas_salina.1
MVGVEETAAMILEACSTAVAATVKPNHTECKDTEPPPPSVCGVCVCVCGRRCAAGDALELVRAEQEAAHLA